MSDTTLRIKLTREERNRVLVNHNFRCFYCGEVADGVDHIIPTISPLSDNSIENLVAACAICNSLAGAKIFPNIETKKAFILERLRMRCPNCGSFPSAKTQKNWPGLPKVESEALGQTPGKVLMTVDGSNNQLNASNE